MSVFRKILRALFSFYLRFLDSPFCLITGVLQANRTHLLPFVSLIASILQQLLN